MGDTSRVGLLRLVAQRLAGPKLPTATEAVSWLTAAQAQEPRGVLTSIALRTAGGSRSGVEADLTSGRVVTSWPLRGTLHLVAAEDLPWMLRVAAPRVLAGDARRRAELGLDAAALARARDLAEPALAGDGLRRADLLAVWDRAGLSTAGQRGYHLLRYLAMTGVLCFGPVRDGEQVVVGVEAWIDRPRWLERDEALGELARRYFRSHGPATVRDFAGWSHLLAADVRTGLAVAGDALARVDLDGVEYVLDPGTAEVLAGHGSEARGVFLLPGFDEFVLGYRDRGAVLPAGFADRIVPGGNGVFRPTVVYGGRVVGTWRRAGRGAAESVEASAFTSFDDGVAGQIDRVFAALPR